VAENDQLEVPDVAVHDPNSFELLRVWVANKAQHVSLRVGVWEDPAAWGIMLADLARHIVSAYSQEGAVDKVQTLRRIKSGFDAEIGTQMERPLGR
jgi:hypothetical protein